MVSSSINEFTEDMKLIIFNQNKDRIFLFQDPQTLRITFADSTNLKTDEKISDTETNQGRSNDGLSLKLKVPEHDLTSDVSRNMPK